MRKIAVFILCLFLIQSFPVQANDVMLQSIQENILQLQKTVEKLQMTVADQKEVIHRQSIQIQDLERTRPSSSPQSTGVITSSPSPIPIAGISQGFNPEIGVNGTVQTKLTQRTEDEEGNDTIALKELELSFAQVVDPYSRLDAILAFNDNLEDQNVDIEEAYYTRWGLPLGFTTQLGKFRAKIGKQNLLHLHQLKTAEYPLVIQDFFGDEGLASSGVRLQNNIPNPFDIPLEITGEVLRGNNGNSFSGISRRPIFNSHLKSYFQPSENTGLELGWTTLFGDENPPTFSEDEDGNTVSETRSSGSDRFGVKVYGADATFFWFLPQEKKVEWQNEIYFQNRSDLVHSNSNPWGFYSLVDYRFSKRFSTGIRFDYLEPLDVNDEHHASTQISPYITFWQSEYASFKLQYSHLEPASADERADNLIYLQVDFLIGAHKHPVQ